MAIVATSALLIFCLGTATAGADVGFRDFSYSGTTAPTRDKPQSKLWFNDGLWWGSM